MFEVEVKEYPEINCFHILLVPVSLTTLGTHYFHTSGQSVPVSLGGTVSSGWTWQVKAPAGTHSNWQQGEAGMKLYIPSWHSALNTLCLSRSTMAWELEPGNKRWQRLQAQRQDNRPHNRHYCAAFNFDFKLQLVENYLCHAWACLPLPHRVTWLIKAII